MVFVLLLEGFQRLSVRAKEICRELPFYPCSTFPKASVMIGGVQPALL